MAHFLTTAGVAAGPPYQNRPYSDYGRVGCHPDRGRKRSKEKTMHSPVARSSPGMGNAEIDNDYDNDYDNDCDDD